MPHTPCYSVRMRTVAAFAALMAGCAPYIYVGDGSIKYRLGSIPWQGETAKIEEDLCGPKQLAAKWAGELVARQILRPDQADRFVKYTCFNWTPEGPTRFEAQRELSKLAATLTLEQVRALDETLKSLKNPAYTVEKLSGMTPEWKLAITLATLVAVGTAGGLAASGEFSGRDRKAAPSSAAAPPPPILP